MMRRAIVILLLIVVATPLLNLPQHAAAQGRSRCFPETGHCVGGAILDYWERNGGLAVFGYPITPLIPNETVEGVWVGPTQWFERDRLEDHGAQGVMAGRLGARLLELQGRPWQQFPQPFAPPDQSCAWFPETRHSLCEPFLSYWQRNGGLARFGYPISEPLRESIEGWTGTVQYFERRRMEHHVEFAGTPYQVLLGRLGADLLVMAPPQRCEAAPPPELRASIAQLPFKEWLGCPTRLYRAIPAAVQPFEYGNMLWLDQGADGRYIYATYRSVEPGNPTVYLRVEDSWREGIDPEEYLPAPPPESGRYAPRRGFGKVWFQHFRRGPNTIGLATAPEQPHRATLQTYSSGAALVWLEDSDQIFAYGYDRHDVASFPRIP